MKRLRQLAGSLIILAAQSPPLPLRTAVRVALIGARIAGWARRDPMRSRRPAYPMR